MRRANSHPKAGLRRAWFPLIAACAAVCWPATAATASTSATPISVTLSPCAPTSAGGPCSVDPAQIQVAIPNNGSIQAVDVFWVADPRRPPSAPSPAQTQAVLGVRSGPGELPTGCQNPPPAPSSAFTVTCWNWPSALEYSGGGKQWLLNGTYRVIPCGATSSSTPCTASNVYSPSVAGVAAPPSSPTGVSTVYSNGTVTVTWTPGPEPDLVGYTVSRNGGTVYSCSTPQAGTGSAPACPSPPSFSDQPAGSGWTYTVRSLRFGADPAPGDFVSSAPYSTSLYAPLPQQSPGAPGAGTAPSRPSVGNAFVPPLPPIGVARPAGEFAGLGGAASVAVPALANEEDGSGALAGSPGNPAFSNHGALGSPLASGTLQRHQKATDSVDIAAELAIAALALALAVHAWYLRGELRAASVRVAARRAASGTAT